MVSPPQSSDISPYSVNSCLTLSGFAPGLSILFIATIIGTLEAINHAKAANVPIIVATTRIAISVA